jgi:Domain of unknown function (DUF4118)
VYLEAVKRVGGDLVYWVGGPLAALVLGACLIPLRDLTPAANLTFAFVALTIVVAQFGGRGVGIATAVASAISLDFFLTRPYFRLAIEDKHDVVAFLGLAACGVIASALGGFRHVAPAEAVTAEEARHASERVRDMHDLAWRNLRWALFVSVAIWIEALWNPLPGFVAWIVVLAQGFFMALAIVYAAVQEQWMRRGTPLGGSGRVVIPKPWSDVEDQRAALWFALGLISIVPWAYVAFGRKAPLDVLYGALACSAVVLLLLGLLAAFARAAPDESGPRTIDERPRV